MDSTQRGYFLHHAEKFRINYEFWGIVLHNLYEEEPFYKAKEFRVIERKILNKLDFNWRGYEKYIKRART